MRTALSAHDRDLARLRRRMNAVGLLYALACTLPAASFLALIITLWRDK